MKVWKAIPIDIRGKKTKYRKFNFLLVLVLGIALIALVSIIVYPIYYNEPIKIDVNTYYITIAATLFTIIYYLDNRRYEQYTSLAIRIEKVKVKDNKLTIEIKNIGSRNISSARIAKLKINGIKVANKRKINFLAVNETTEFDIDTFQVNCLNKIDYKVYILLNKNLLSSKFEQEMKFVDGEYIISPNTCREIKREMYYKFFSVGL